MKRLLRKSIAGVLLLALLLACTGCSKQTPAKTATIPVQTLAPTAQPDAAPAADGSDGEVVKGALGSTVEMDGVTYKLRRNLKTVLFMGIDKASTVHAVGSDIVGNNGRADALMLFILDEETRTAQTVVISRDTMTEVDVYQTNGDLGYSGEMQICMQYAFGNSDTRSCFITARTVSELLYGVKIDGYLAFIMDGIQPVVDAIGGVEVTLPEDYLDISPDYVAGTHLTLDGPMTERFVRYRKKSEADGNTDRAMRHEFILQSVFQQMMGVSANEMTSLMEVAEPYLVTNLDGETLKALARYDLSEEKILVPGLADQPNYYYEYHVDEPALQRLIIDLFYEPMN